jgi:hypothetical protein
MPQLVVWPYMARTMVEDAPFVKVRLSAKSSPRDELL